MKDKGNARKEEISKELKDLVLARIEAQTPSNLRLFIGTNGLNLSKQEIIQHIKSGDDIGIKIMKVHLRFLKALASGEFTTALASAENE